ncbi:MAG: cysteine--tRNA ligase [Pseudomonadota bacterium]
MTEIRLWNTRDRAEQPVVARDGRVGMYVCGPTVYDRAHVGNARPAVVFDVLFRLLRHVHGDGNVTYVRNITDIDDKINARAAETRQADERVIDAVARITAETGGWYLEDMAAIGCLEPTRMPRATAFVPEMVGIIETLIERGHAYAAEGHVLFSVGSWESYGSLSRRSTDELLAGARVDVAPYKRDPMDFVLWKPSTEDQPGWESPWSYGRPGWHIECSAMSKAILGPLFGERFQIHGGGIDLVFPHHENERAQSCAAHGIEDMADIWAHNGFLMVEGEKMSKSLGNFITVADLREKGVPGEVIRYVLLSAQYRQPLDWTADRVEQATTVLRRWRAIAAAGAEPGEPPAEVVEALADDLNTPAAFAALHRMAGTGDAAGLAAGASLLGLLTPALAGWDAAPEADAGTASRIDALLEERAAARKAKDFSRADAIRDGLVAAGVDVKDTPQGASWTLAPDFDPTKLLEATS